MKTSFALSSLVVLLAASASAQDYPIKIQQPLEVGQRYQFQVVANESSESSMSSEHRGPATEKEDLTVEMESVVTVLAVDAKGRSTKESHTISKLLWGTGKEPILAAKTEVIASRPERSMKFEIGGKPVTGAVAKALELAVDITAGGPTDDEIFGTSERKRVGDSWPVNEALALKEANEMLSASGLSVASVGGTTALEKVANDGGVEVIHLRANIAATVSPVAKGPFTTASATMNAAFTGAFPRDNTKSVREEGATMSMTFNASGKPNPEAPVMQLSRKVKRSAIRQFKLLD